MTNKSRNIILAIFFVIFFIASLIYFRPKSQSTKLTTVPASTVTITNEELAKKPTDQATPLPTANTQQPKKIDFFVDISSPVNNSTVNSADLVVRGKTTPHAEIFINDLETKADDQGNFFLNLILDEGENILSILANDTEGNYLEKEITVTLSQ